MSDFSTMHFACDLPPDGKPCTVELTTDVLTKQRTLVVHVRADGQTKASECADAVNAFRVNGASVATCRADGGDVVFGR